MQTLRRVIETTEALYRDYRLVSKEAAANLAASLDDPSVLAEAEAGFRTTISGMTPRQSEHIRIFFERVRTNIISRAA